MDANEIKARQAGIVARLRGHRARGRTTRGSPDGMNQTERAYSDHLGLRLLAGEVVAWHCHAVKFRLGDRSWYEPDFLVMLDNGLVEIHEIKGHMEDDAAVKLRIFPEPWYWFPLVIVRRTKGGAWEYERR